MRAIRTIPIRRVANRPNLFWGGDREMVQVSLLITFVLVVAAQNTYAFVIGLVFWFFALYALRKLAKYDPLLRFVGLRSITKYKRF
ncbi:conjugal transfer protein TrbD, partial [Staphylococcus aureus]|nr:conjugal transfer protein TrbD [Staphylococcus aureus]